jgi:DNA-binding NtrC family response regulator
MRNATLLVVDDDEAIRRGLSLCLKSRGYTAIEAANAAEAIAAAQTSLPDLALVDLKLPDMDGLSLLKRLREIDPMMAVIVLSGYVTIPLAVEAIQWGAADVLEKPCSIEHAGLAIERALRGRILWRELSELRAKVGVDTAAILGESRAMKRVLRAVRQVAAAPNTTVLIRGESGAGKELVARAIHAASARAHAPFLALNCAAIAESLLEAELFGYERGAFTGALHRGKTGLFEAADGGTLFLDEVGETGPELQAKLLRVLQERTFLRVGGVRQIAVDVRVIASTNRDLEAAVAAGRFRQDLYYRLNVVEIRVPPLRERRADIPLLARAFLARFARELGKPIRGFTKGAMADLLAHSWPGNVRELKNAIERAVIVSPGPLLRRGHFSLLRRSSAASGEGAASVARAKTLTEIERAHIQRTLERCRWNQSQAARELGIHRTTLAKKIEEFGLAPLRTPAAPVPSEPPLSKDPTGLT